MALTVPYMRKCIRCKLTLPSVQFLSFLAERFSDKKLVRDNICLYCREKGGETKQDVLDRLMGYLNHDCFDKPGLDIEAEAD